ncbi:MAG TPA: hypothetical protein VJ010_01950, partial [Actinomycetota bacterium]|nr:hypothetical protein [Actinomycetota bacterium]
EAAGHPPRGGRRCHVGPGRASGVPARGQEIAGAGEGGLEQPHEGEEATVAAVARAIFEGGGRPGGTP